MRTDGANAVDDSEVQDERLAARKQRLRAERPLVGTLAHVQETRLQTQLRRVCPVIECANSEQ